MSQGQTRQITHKHESSTQQIGTQENLCVANHLCVHQRAHACNAFLYVVCSVNRASPAQPEPGQASPSQAKPGQARPGQSKASSGQYRSRLGSLWERKFEGEDCTRKLIKLSRHVFVKLFHPFMHIASCYPSSQRFKLNHLFI